MKGSNEEVSRRIFLTGAAAMAVGTAAIGLGACTTETPAETPSEDGSNTETWDLETDVIVAGSGVGLAAAVAARQNGAEVIVIESGDHVGGLWLAASGGSTMGGNNIVQQRDGETRDSEEQWYQDEMWTNERRGNPDIMRMLVKEGPETVKWMQDLGMVWAPLGPGQLRGDIKRGVRPDQNPGVYIGGAGTPNSGIAWVQVWQNSLKETGVEPWLKHRLIRLFREPEGPVTGALVENEGTQLRIRARKGVILATGTWTDNERMAYAWDPRIVGENCYGDGGIPSENKQFVYSGGDGHLAAAEVGAGFSDMSFVSYLYIFYGARSYWGWGEDPVDWTVNDGYCDGQGIDRPDEFFKNVILVNDGKRYINECLGYRPTVPGRGNHSENPELPYTKTYLEIPIPRNVWAVADSTMAETLKWPLDEIHNPNIRTGYMFDPACLAIADTLDELAQKMGFDTAVFKETVGKYNSYVDTGTDDEFGKPEFGSRLETPPFYGLKASLIRHTQRNGLRVNTKLQVLQQSDQFTAKYIPNVDNEAVIPHLYAAGEAANTLGYRRCHTSLGHYVTGARIAGIAAAKETAI